MLILARYPQEAILIGEIKVTILDIVRWKNGRTRVKLGIEAPPEILILRAELTHLSSHERHCTQTHLEVYSEDHGPAMPADVREETGA